MSQSEKGVRFWSRVCFAYCIARRATWKTRHAKTCLGMAESTTAMESTCCRETIKKKKKKMRFRDIHYP